MGFQEMLSELDRAYQYNVQIVRTKHLRSDGHELVGEAPSARRKIPILSGLSGIGKTSAVREFAEVHQLQFIQIDCSYLPGSALAAYLHNSIAKIESGNIAGCILLVDNISDADEDWYQLFEQYADNRLDIEINVQDLEESDTICKSSWKYDSIPETLFIVGEQRPD